MRFCWIWFGSSARNTHCYANSDGFAAAQAEWAGIGTSMSCRCSLWAEWSACSWSWEDHTSALHRQYRQSDFVTFNLNHKNLCLCGALPIWWWTAGWIETTKLVCLLNMLADVCSSAVVKAAWPHAICRCKQMNFFALNDHPVLSTPSQKVWIWGILQWDKVHKSGPARFAHQPLSLFQPRTATAWTRRRRDSTTSTRPRRARPTPPRPPPPPRPRRHPRKRRRRSREATWLTKYHTENPTQFPIKYCILGAPPYFTAANRSGLIANSTYSDICRTWWPV